MDGETGVGGVNKGDAVVSEVSVELSGRRLGLEVFVREKPHASTGGVYG